VTASRFFGAFLARGKFEKELKELQKKALQEPRNIHLLLKIGDMLDKMGKRREALVAYRKCSERYAQKGFLIQAIAVNKVILRLDPSQSKIQDLLAELYDQRGMVVEENLQRRAMGRELVEAEEEAMPEIPLFSDLKKEELARIMERIQAKKFNPKERVCKEGEPGDSIFVISHGKVGVFRDNLRGEKICLNELKAGDFFGEFGFFADARRHATVEALAETTVLEITKKDLQEIIQEFPSLSQVLFNFYKERVLDTLLATSPLFQSFSPQERREILGMFAAENFPAGAMVLEEGTPGDTLYIIKKGEVEVFTTDAQKNLQTLARLREGDFFGEISLLTGRPRTASVKVLQPAEFMRLSKKDFDKIVVNHPEVKKVLEESLYFRLENKLKMLGVLHDSPAKEGMV